MPLVNSLLTAIVRANGDALVLHAGERPYVVAPTGQLELASRALTLDAVRGMLNELLPADARQSLDELGAVQHELGIPAFTPGQSFCVIAARGGDDIWIEIRRQRILAAVEAPVQEPAPPQQSEAVLDVSQDLSHQVVPEPEAPEPEPEPEPEQETMATPDPAVEHAHVLETVPEPEAVSEPQAVQKLCLIFRPNRLRSRCQSRQNRFRSRGTQ